MTGVRTPSTSLEGRGPIQALPPHAQRTEYQEAVSTVHGMVDRIRYALQDNGAELVSLDLVERREDVQEITNHIVGNVGRAAVELSTSECKRYRLDLELAYTADEGRNHEIKVSADLDNLGSFAIKRAVTQLIQNAKSRVSALGIDPQHMPAQVC